MPSPTTVNRRTLLALLGGPTATPLLAARIALAQQAWPGRAVRYVNGAAAGVGTTLHLSGEMMNSMAGVEVTHIPYKGAAPALTDLLGGRVDLLFDNLPGSLPSVRAGQIKPVAVTARARIPELPDVPTMAEVLPGYEITSWTAMIGPANMKADLVAQVNALTVKALPAPPLKARYTDLRATPWPTSPAEIKTFRDSEEVRLLPILKAAGIKPE